MPTRTEPLNPESRVFTYSQLKSIFLDGECYAFATAMHDAFDWPLVGLVGTDRVVYHAGVKAPDGRLFDARGFVSTDNFAKPFGIPCAYTLEPVGLDQLIRDREPEHVRRHSVMMARRMAEAVWPDMPWKDSALIRARRFCDALEALSREHGFWIRGPYAAARPHLSEACGEEDGYGLRPTDDGQSFTIDRRFLES